MTKRHGGATMPVRGTRALTAAACGSVERNTKFLLFVALLSLPQLCVEKG